MAYLQAPLAKPSMTMKRSTKNVALKDSMNSQPEPPTIAALKDSGEAYAEYSPVNDPKLKDEETR